MMKKKNLYFFNLFLLFISLLLVGCRSSNQLNNTVSSSTDKTIASGNGKKETNFSKDEYNTIGKQTDKADEYELLLENQMGYDILNISVKDMASENSDNVLMELKTPFLKDEKRIFYFDPAAIKVSADEELSDGEKLFNPGFDVSLTLDNDNELVIHGFPFYDASEVKLLLQDGVAYVEYISTETDEYVSTLEMEKMQKEIESGQ